jgi:hypothetical protein
MSLLKQQIGQMEEEEKLNQQIKEQLVKIGISL